MRPSALSGRSVPGSFFCFRKIFSPFRWKRSVSLEYGYPPGDGYISHQTGKGIFHLQNAIFGGYVSFLEGIYHVTCSDGNHWIFFNCGGARCQCRQF